MPAPVWNHAPAGRNGGFAPGFDRRSPLTPDYTPQWSPPIDPRWPQTTEPGGGILKGSIYDMNGMGDFFTFPQGQADSAQAFYEQQIRSAAMAPPPANSPAGRTLPPGSPMVIGDPMDEGSLYNQTQSRAAGLMPWERGPAPWEQSPPAGIVPGFLPPDQAPQAIAAMDAAKIASGEAKAGEAAQAAKIAADNAVRAASIGAAKVAATHAATAQAAANVAAGVAKTNKAQSAASLAQSEATKAVAAANVAAKKAGVNNGNGMGDFLELSGMGGMGFMDTNLGFGIQLKHVLLGLGLGVAGYAAVKKFRG